MSATRDGPISVKWSADNIGAVSLDGEVFCRIEWSEKKQQFCIEDAAGQCLRHVASIKGMSASKEEAEALAVDMVRSGAMPDPATAQKEHRERQRAARAKRAQQPAQVRKAAERKADEGKLSAVRDAAWEARRADKAAGPLYEALAEAFDFADAELWKSNSFAMLRPRLVIHVRARVAALESDLAEETRRSKTQPFAMYASTEQRKRAAEYRKAETSSAIAKIEAKLARARTVLGHLEGPA